MTQAAGKKHEEEEEEELQILYCASTGPIHFEAMDPAHSDAWRRSVACRPAEEDDGRPPIADEYGGVLERLADGAPLRCTVCGEWIYRGRYVAGSPS